MPANKTTKLPEQLCKLSIEEQKDPALVFDALFDMARLPQIRSMLWEWLKSTVTGSYPKTLSAKERMEIVLLYEQFEKLIEAAYLVRERKRGGKK